MYFAYSKTEARNTFCSPWLAFSPTFLNLQCSYGSTTKEIGKAKVSITQNECSRRCGLEEQTGCCEFSTNDQNEARCKWKYGTEVISAPSVGQNAVACVKSGNYCLAQKHKMELNHRFFSIITKRYAL